MMMIDYFEEVYTGLGIKSPWLEVKGRGPPLLVEKIWYGGAFLGVIFFCWDQTP